MKCLKCGAYIYPSDKFCRSCGTTLNNDTCQYGDNIPNSKYDSSSCHESQYNYSYSYSNKQKPNYNMSATHEQQYNYNTNYSYDMTKYDYAYKPNDSGGDKYVKAYIGPNYEKLKNMKFSLPALIFGPLYLLYRKVWGYAIAAIFISIASTQLLEANLANAIDLIIHIFFALKFKEIYFKQAESKVENIEQQSLDKSTNELLEICRKKGGISLKIIAILFLISFFSIIALSTYFITKTELTTPLPDEENIATIEKIGELTYNVPYSYIQIHSSESYQKLKNGNCYITIEKRIPYGSYSEADSYLNSLTAPSSGIESINYNGHEWKYKQLNYTNYYNTIYAYKYNETLYLLRLDNTNIHSCNTQYKQILQTLKFSKQ